MKGDTRRPTSNATQFILDQNNYAVTKDSAKEKSKDAHHECVISPAHKAISTAKRKLVQANGAVTARLYPDGKHGRHRLDSWTVMLLGGRGRTWSHHLLFHKVGGECSGYRQHIVCSVGDQFISSAGEQRGESSPRKSSGFPVSHTSHRSSRRKGDLCRSDL